MLTEPLSTIMTENVITVGPTSTLAEVKDILFERHIHHMPVVTGPEKKLVGIITSYDLMKQDCRFADYEKIEVGNVMTTHVATLGPKDQIGAAATLFLKHLFHGLPIVDDQRRLVGIVTTHDVLKFQYFREYPNDSFVRDTDWISV